IADCFSCQRVKEHVETQYGNMHCIMTGTRKANRPVILTFHDIGLNHKSCFETLFNHMDMQEITRQLPVCHVEAPGQHVGAKTLPNAYTYPSMDQLSEALPAVLSHFGVIGLGVGAGAYILARFALNHPDLVDGLVLININPNSEGLMHTVANKITEWTHTLPDQVIAHLFGKHEIQTNHDLIATYRHHISVTMNQSNVSQFFRSYNNRNTLEVERPVPGGNINVRTLKCATLLVVGDNSPAVEVVVDCNAKLNPTNTTLLKVAGRTKHHKECKTLSSASMTRLRSRTTSSSSFLSFDGSRSRSHTNELQHGQTHSDEKRGRTRHNTDVSMESISNSNVDQIISKSTEVAC
uniref:N-myc downstream regulated 1b n=1 Tax=Anabas testudineus TaxID=64144 RepID=A0A7N6AHF0_ANATE